MKYSCTILGYVLLQDSSITKMFRTVWTSKWLFSCMCSNVRLEVAFYIKFCWAQVAGIWFFSSMCSHVSFHFTLMGSTKWTKRTCQWLCCFVTSNVFIILAPWQLQWTVWALKYLLASVRVEQSVCCSSRSNCEGRKIAAFDCNLQEMLLLFTADKLRICLWKIELR